MKTVAFFNNKGGVGKTSLVYHISWMLHQLGHRVVVADLDPQANLTTFFLKEEQILALFEPEEGIARTIFQAFKPILEATGDLAVVTPIDIADGLTLIPGDLALSEAEDALSREWSECLSSNRSSKIKAFRTECGFYRVIETVAKARNADIALIDVGPNLGSLNRAALIASDYVVIPLGSDAFSLQGLRNVGRRVREWRSDWKRKREDAPDDLNFSVPEGGMQPLGYLLSRFSIRQGRQSMSYQSWANKMPSAYQQSVLGLSETAPSEPKADPHCLAELKDYRSLMPMAQDANKPIFKLQTADGAIGAHQTGVSSAFDDFQALTNKILKLIETSSVNDQIEMPLPSL
jgi:chromosome partitioning protein